MIETRRLKNVVIFIQTILSFVLSRKIMNIILTFEITKVSIEINIAAGWWNVYGKMVWEIPHKWKKLSAAKENGKKALDIDPFTVAWMLKRKS